MDEVVRTFTEPWVTQIIRFCNADKYGPNFAVEIFLRLYHDDNLVEVGWIVGPIPVDDGIGKEVIVRYLSKLPFENNICSKCRFCTDISNQGQFFTDSNGRQMMERRLNYRPSFEINMTEPTAQNYYPVNAKIIIKDSTSQMGVLTDRSQGGSSLQDGCMELMVHRRLLDDDAFGVGEALNEFAYGDGLVAAGKHVLLLNNDEQSFNEEHRIKAMDLYHEPLIIFGNLEQGTNFPDSVKLTSSLPDNVHILTLRKITNIEDPFGQYLFLQIEHIFESDEHDTLGQPVDIDLENLFDFSSIFVESYRETSLGGNIWLDELQRLVFNKDSNEIPSIDEDHMETSQWVIRLNPMDIRSFILKYD